MRKLQGLLREILIQEIRVAIRTHYKTIVAACGALLLAVAGPAMAQAYSDGYKFLKAVEDRDGTVATEMLREPGTTIVNSRDITSGETGLHIVTRQRNATWIRFLAQEGANPNIADKNGVTPLMLATQLGYIEGVEALIAANARVDVTNNAGETPLISAVHNRDISLLEVLLEAGADPDRTDNSGRSARQYAGLSGVDRRVAETIEKNEQPADERASAGRVYGPSF